MSDSTSVFNLRIPAGAIVAHSQGVLGQPAQTHASLNKGITAETFNLVDSANISQAARVADEVASRNARITGNPGTAAAAPVINGIAELGLAARKPPVR